MNPYTKLFRYGSTLELKELLKHELFNKNQNHHTHDSETLLCLASYYGLSDMVKVLIQSGSSVNKADGYGNTPLIMSAYGGYIKIAKMLIMVGADRNLTDNDGHTPLQIAMDYQHTGIAELMTKQPKIMSLQNLCLRVVHYGGQIIVPEWFPPLLLEWNE